MPCFFCTVPADQIVAANGLCLAFRDGYPVSEGHTLVVPRRHVVDWFHTTSEEQRALFELVDRVVRQLEVEYRPDGFNVGFNLGEAAGQSVPHLHVHVIPRRAGDVDDPTGGVRLVIPDRGNYKRPGFVPRSNKS
ncbi:MAG: HIT family protein [Pseudomonadota bacterium]